MLYALCPMPYALCPVVPHMRARKAIYESPPLLALEKTGATNPTNKAMGTAYPSNIRFLSFKLANMAISPFGLGS
jgi:hypothetical protein